MRLPALSLTILPSLAAVPVAAQSLQLDEIVVSANRTPTPAERTGSAVSVITEETFQADGRPFLLQYLADQPGVTINQNGPPGAVSGLTVRGAPKRYVQVRIDGIPIADPSSPTNDPDLAALIVDDFSRVEVLEGSQSALYGGQAVAGVIDITSARATEDGLQTTYRLEGGSYETFRGAVGLAGRDERGEFALNVVRYQTDGFSAAEADDGNDEADGFEVTRLSATGTLYATETASVFASAFWQKEDGDADAFAGSGGDSDRLDGYDRESWGVRGGTNFALMDQRLENELAVSYFHVDRTEESSFGPFEAEGARTRVEYLGRYGFSDAMALQFGADWSRETSETNFSDGERASSITGVFAQADWTPTEALAINAALRHDQHSEFGGYPTGRLTAAYLLDPATVLRASLGTGFRAPSNDELFAPYGDPDFEPETSRSADAGVERSFAEGRGTLGATLFWLEIDDQISFDPVTFLLVQADGTSESRGVELAGDWALTDSLALSGAYTYTYATKADGSRADRVPRHEASLFLSGSARERISYSVGARLVGDYHDSTGPEDSANFEEDFVVVSARAGYALNDSAELYVRAENLLGAEYQTARGYGTPGQSFYFGVVGRF